MRKKESIVKPCLQTLSPLTAAALLFIATLAPALAQVKPAANPESKIKTRVLLIFDFSNSMYGVWESESKITVAKRLVNQMVDSLSRQPNVELALRCYGHQKSFPPQDCDDTKLEVAFAPDNGAQIKSRINKLIPRGTTPIALSLEACASDFPPGAAKNIVLLITDGKEECGGDPCAISAALQSKGIILKPFIVGIGALDESIKQSFQCVGNFYDSSTESSFKQVLNIIITQVLNPSTCQVNLLDKNGKPTETDVPLSFYDMQSGMQRYHFVHTLNNRGMPDTLRIDALTTYKIVAHTLPPVEVRDVKLTPGKHTIIPIDTPQGMLKVQLGEHSSHKDVGYIIRKKGENNTLQYGTMKEVQKLIVGQYDLEVLTLPRTLIAGLTISQSHTTTVKIDEPGSITITYGAVGTGAIMIKKDRQWEWVTSLNQTATQENFRLQPGQYKVVFRAKSAKETMFSIEKDFTVISGQTQQLSLK